MRDTSHETTTSSVAGVDASSSKCAIADDPTYGYTPTNPVKVGGEAIYAAAREIRYFDALRGPTGQGIHYKRLGAIPEKPPNSSTFLDVYELSYEGLEKPIQIYANAYEWDPPKAPRGLICGVVMELVRPNPSPQERFRQSAAVAIEWGLKGVPPIPLDADGTVTHGVIFDHTRIIGLAARFGSSSNPPTPESLPPDAVKPHLVVVAFSIQCGGQTVAPESIALLDVNGDEPGRLATARGDEVATLLPGYAPPSSAAPALAVSYAVASLIPGVRAAIKYPGCSTSPEMSLPIRSEPAKLEKFVHAAVPAGAQPPAPETMVVLQTYINVDHTLKFPIYVQGPGDLLDAAIGVVGEWRVAPATMNGAPVLATQNIGVGFAVP
jgi:hypothetical protein